jgi:hypothetical protein
MEFCKDCKHCDLFISNDKAERYVRARCLASKKNDLVSGEASYSFCSVERFGRETCPNFEVK